MNRKLPLALAAAFLCLFVSGSAGSAEEAPPRSWNWPENGMFGTYDRAALQRGFQVYREVCSACHAMHLMAYRNLSALGYNESEIKAIAASVTITDGPNDQGEMFDRPGKPSDHFKSPFPNVEASKAANGGAYPKDLSLIVKAREGNEDYIYSLLTGYKPKPDDVTVAKGLYYNDAFPGHQIAMPPPLSDGRVDFGKDESGKPVPNDLDSEAKDVVQFLAWASEPHLEDRHRMGFSVMIFLVAFAGILYAAKRRVWQGLH
jgi:ubiquinol-cytochrome c reductase cytochrome c1 subunit